MMKFAFLASCICDFGDFRSSSENFLLQTFLNNVQLKLGGCDHRWKDPDTFDTPHSGWRYIGTALRMQRRLRHSNTQKKPFPFAPRKISVVQVEGRG